MIIATKESFVGSFTYYLNGYITEPGHELPFSDQKPIINPFCRLGISTDYGVITMRPVLTQGVDVLIRAIV